MTSIEENTERLDLLQKTAVLEEKQRKRIIEINAEKDKDLEQQKMINLLQQNRTSNSVLEQEEGHRNMLVEAMTRNSNSSNAPTVRVLTNVQGIILLLFFISFQAKMHF